MTVVEMARLYEAGLSLREVAAEAHYSHTEVRKLLLRAGVEMRARGCPPDDRRRVGRIVAGGS
jgi:hypothetical protein